MMLPLVVFFQATSQSVPFDATVALDTAATNAPAQALYERAGFTVTERRPPNGRIPGIIGYARATRG